MTDKVNYLGGIIDSEYDVLKNLSKNEVVTYLKECCGATLEEAEEAVDGIFVDEIKEKEEKRIKLNPEKYCCENCFLRKDLHCTYYSPKLRKLSKTKLDSKPYWCPGVKALYQNNAFIK